MVTLAIAGCAPAGDRIDPDFDTRVARPAYRAGGPRVLFDEAHRNVHRSGGSYRPFVKLVEADGYRVERGTAAITAERLRPFAVLIIAGAQGANERNDDPAFQESECDVVRDWVAAGGSLLLVTDHYPFGHAAERLASRFGVRLSKGVVEDSARYDPAFEPTHLVYSREGGGIEVHPIVEGRDSSERVRRVLTFTGEAVHAPPPAVRFLAVSSTAVARLADARVERHGGDVRVLVTYGSPVAVPGWAQGLALRYGRGRVVVLGELAMLSARLRRGDGRPIGMNVRGYDNRQLALNIMHWLTGIL